MMMAKDPWKKKPFLLLSGITLLIGSCGDPMITRLYFLNGGNNLWLSSWLQSAGFPIILIPLTAAYVNRRANTDGEGDDDNAKLFVMQPSLFLQSSLLGLIYGLENYLYVYGASKLPVSTSTLVASTQLIFISAFSFLLVKQKFTLHSMTAIVLLTVGSAVLALNGSNDLPEGESDREYVLGFVSILSMTVLMGLFVPLTEMMIGKAKQVVDYTLTMEINLVICLFATVFSTAGMLVDHDFQALLTEARKFELTEVTYYVIIVSIMVTAQCVIVGTTGMIFCSSSLFYGITTTALLPVTEMLGVIVYGESFRVEKVLALLLSLAGFTSYFCGEIEETKKQDQNFETDSSLLIQHV